MVSPLCKVAGVERAKVGDKSELKKAKNTKIYGGNGQERKEGIDGKLTSIKGRVSEREIGEERRARTGGISEEKS